MLYFLHDHSHSKRLHRTQLQTRRHRHLYVLDERLQQTAMLYLVGLLSGAQVEYKPVDSQL